MGLIRVSMEGTFPTRKATFNGREGGHAMAISRAIEFLNSQLPWAIERDHCLHDKGDRPDKSPFGTVPSRTRDLKKGNKNGPA